MTFQSDSPRTISRGINLIRKLAAKNIRQYAEFMNMFQDIPVDGTGSGHHQEEYSFLIVPQERNLSRLGISSPPVPACLSCELAGHPACTTEWRSGVGYRVCLSALLPSFDTSGSFGASGTSGPSAPSGPSGSSDPSPKILHFYGESVY
jgi:hypothetical protein